MYGKLIHTEHRIETVSEFYYDATQELITERKSLTNNRTRVYEYSISKFKTIYKDSRINECFHKLN